MLWIIMQLLEQMELVTLNSLDLKMSHVILSSENKIKTYWNQYNTILHEWRVREKVWERHIYWTVDIYMTLNLLCKHREMWKHISQCTLGKEMIHLCYLMFCLYCLHNLKVKFSIANAKIKRRSNVTWQCRGKKRLNTLIEI